MDTALPSISPAELIPRLGRADAPLLLDVRRRERFAAAGFLLAGARYCAPEDVAGWARSEASREVVVYCVYGHEVSQDAARTLLAAGWQARYLQGGIEGGEPGIDRREDIERWRSTPVPRMAKPVTA